MIRRALVILVTIVGLSGITAPVHAIDLTGNCGDLGVECNLVDDNNLNMSSNNAVAGAIRWALWILAAISVIVIVIAAFQFVISQGNQDKVRKARMTILYAAIGLVVALAAAAIVQYVTDNLL